MKDLSFQAKSYLFLSYLTGAAVLAQSLFNFQLHSQGALLVLCILASLALIFKVEGTTNRSHYTISFLVYGFTFAYLGTTEALIVVAVSNLVEWIWNRPPWFIQAFNVSCYIIVLKTASIVFYAIDPGGVLSSGEGVLAIFASMLTFTLLNHLMVGIIVWLARGENFKESGIFDFLPLMIDFTLICLGAGLVIVWQYNPFSIVLFLIPLYLIYSTLRVPALERKTEIDSKTGTYNHGYFMKQLEHELNRTNRFDRPLSIIIADLDLLRNINNTYGHLAGDEVLIGIATILKRNVREYDVVARFGGEEFAILMPETSIEQAFERAEMIRKQIAASEFNIPTSITPIKATISLGIACRERYNQTGQEIIHNADTALYHSKLRGRNQTYAYDKDAYVAFLGNPDAEHDGSEPAHAGTKLDNTPDQDFQAAQSHYVPTTEKELSSAPPPPPPSNAFVPKVEAKGTKWKVYLFIGSMAIVAMVALFIVHTWLFPLTSGFNSLSAWLGLMTFAVFVIVAEWFSIDIYVRNTAISTSAAPILAGTLLFGPLGALVLSLSFAVTAWIKYRSPFNRFIFNWSNQLIAAMIYTALILLTGKTFSEWSLPFQLALCLVSVFIVYISTTGLVSVGMSIDLQQPLLQIWREKYSWLVPFYVGMGFVSYALVFGYAHDFIMGSILMLVPLLLIRLSEKQYIDRTKEMVAQLREKNLSLERKSEEIFQLNEGLLDTLADIIDLRDPYVLGHSKNVTGYAIQICRMMELHENQTELVRKASLLHDIGKLGIPMEVLSKPARLTLDEYEIVKTHAALGSELIQKSPSLRPLMPIIRHHHEHYDGHGYPDKLKGNAIPLEARIVAVADAIEAMTSDRPYRKGWEPSRIIDELKRHAGTQFDPRIVECAIRVLEAQIKVRKTMEDDLILAPPLKASRGAPPF